MKYGIRTSSVFQGPIPLTTEHWIEASPSPEEPSIFKFRIRQRVNLMCSLNTTHVAYYDKFPDPDPVNYHAGKGYVLPRLAYNASGNCDDRFCNTTLTDPLEFAPSYLSLAEVSERTPS
eukprot:8934028-Pyramimonas_sp.AAC.1